MDEDFARLRMAILDYEETPYCPVCRETLIRIKLICIQRYHHCFSQVEEVIRETYKEIINNHQNGTGIG